MNGIIKNIKKEKKQPILQPNDLCKNRSKEKYIKIYVEENSRKKQ